MSAVFNFLYEAITKLQKRPYEIWVNYIFLSHCCHVLGICLDISPSKASQNNTDFQLRPVVFQHSFLEWEKGIEKTMKKTRGDYFLLETMTPFADSFETYSIVVKLIKMREENSKGDYFVWKKAMRKQLKLHRRLLTSCNLRLFFFFILS